MRRHRKIHFKNIYKKMRPLSRFNKTVSNKFIPAARFCLLLLRRCSCNTRKIICLFGTTGIVFAALAILLCGIFYANFVTSSSCYKGCLKFYYCSESTHDSFEINSCFLTCWQADNWPSCQYQNCSEELYFACRFGETNEARKLLQRRQFTLLRSGGGGELPSGWQCWRVAVGKGQADVVRMLIHEFRVDVNQHDSQGRTALHSSSSTGHLDVVKVLCEDGHANTEVKSVLGWTPLMVAAWRERYDVLEYLLKKGAWFNQTNRDGDSAIELTTNVTIKRLLKKYGAIEPVIGDPNKEKELFDLCVEGDVNGARFMFLTKQADVNAKYNPVKHGAKFGWNKGQTCLMAAAWRGRTELVQMLTDQFKANVDQQDAGGIAAVHRAAFYGHLATIRVLHESGKANLNVQTNDFTTPLILASSQGHHEVVEYLLQQGVHVNERDEDGCTALKVANGEKVEQLLLHYGAKLYNEATS